MTVRVKFALGVAVRNKKPAYIIQIHSFLLHATLATTVDY